MPLRSLAFVLAFLSAATAVSLPWMLGDEYAAACFTPDKEDLPIPPGFYLRWNTTPSVKMRATQASDIAYAIVISDDFWKAASNKVLLGAKYDFYKNACRAENPECTLSTATQCCVWHANVHSCLSSSFQCEPWVPTTNGTNGTVLATSTASQVGGSQIFKDKFSLPQGSWIIIAHIKIMTFQCFGCCLGCYR